MREEYGPNFITLTDDDGKEIELEYVDALEYKGKTYSAFFPVVEEDADEDEEEIALAPGVSVVQKDIRMVQLAKSAVCAGMRTILETSGTEPAEVAALYIAGGFGAFLDKHSAARIGLYPAELEQKVRVLGNAALSGASMILRQKAFIGKTEAFAGNASVVELSGNPVFSEYYMEGMLF